MKLLIVKSNKRCAFNRSEKITYNISSQLAHTIYDVSRLLYTHLSLFYINTDHTASGFPFPASLGALQGGLGGLSSSLSDLTVNCCLILLDGCF